MKADPRERRDWLGVEVNVKWGAWGAILALKAPGLILERLGQQGWVGDDSKHSIQGMVSSFVYQALSLPGAVLHTLHVLFFLCLGIPRS